MTEGLSIVQYLEKRERDFIAAIERQEELLKNFDPEKTKEFISRLTGALEFTRELLAAASTPTAPATEGDDK